VIVTSRRRREALQDVPVTVLGYYRLTGRRCRGIQRQQG
jgi:hypothetical protein